MEAFKYTPTTSPSNATLPLPVHLCGREFFEGHQDLREWYVAVIRRDGRYYALVMSSLTLDTNEVLHAPGAAIGRVYTSAVARLVQVAGWVWYGKIAVSHSLISYQASISALDQAFMSYAGYLKEAVRCTVAEDLRLARAIHRCNQVELLKAVRELQQRAFNDLEPDMPYCPEEMKTANVAMETLLLEFDEQRQETKSETAMSIESVEESVPLELEVIKPLVSRGFNFRGANKELLDSIEPGVIKPLMQAPPPSVLDPLYKTFPNFRVALDAVAKQLHLLQRAGRPVPLKMRPLLLLGQPGLGKTYFAFKLAKTLGLPPVEIDFAVVTAGFVIAGSSPQWAEAKHGLVFEHLVQGEYANPMFIGNEVHLAAQEGVRYPPLGPLLTLLDPKTACRFKDEFAEVYLDTSHLFWVFTANDTDSLSDAILRRMSVVDIPVPSKDELKVIAQSMYQDLLESEPWGDSFPRQLSASVIDQLTGYGTPSNMYEPMLDALGQAAKSGAKELLTEHLPGQAQKRRPIGFI